MGEIPGKDNYAANITANAMGESAYPVTGCNGQPLNCGYYNRVFRVFKKDAMGLNTRRRGFKHQNVFMAATTNSKVAPMSLTSCYEHGENRVCETFTERWSYAFP